MSYEHRLAICCILVHCKRSCVPSSRTPPAPNMFKTNSLKTPNPCLVCSYRFEELIVNTNLEPANKLEVLTCQISLTAILH